MNTSVAFRPIKSRKVDTPKGAVVGTVHPVGGIKMAMKRLGIGQSTTALSPLPSDRRHFPVSTPRSVAQQDGEDLRYCHACKYTDGRIARRLGCCRRTVLRQRETIRLGAVDHPKSTELLEAKWRCAN